MSLPLLPPLHCGRLREADDTVVVSVLFVKSVVMIWMLIAVSSAVSLCTVVVRDSMAGLSDVAAAAKYTIASAIFYSR